MSCDTLATVNFALEAFPFDLALNVLLTTCRSWAQAARALIAL